MNWRYLQARSRPTQVVSSSWVRQKDLEGRIKRKKLRDQGSIRRKRVKIHRQLQVYISLSLKLTNDKKIKKIKTSTSVKRMTTLKSTLMTKRVFQSTSLTLKKTIYSKSTQFRKTNSPQTNSKRQQKLTSKLSKMKLKRFKRILRCCNLQDRFY